MTFRSLAQSLGWLAVLSGVIGTSAQYFLSAMAGVEGVSLATWFLFVYMGCFWTAYGVWVHSAEFVLGNLLILALPNRIIFRLEPWRRWAVPTRALG